MANKKVKILFGFSKVVIRIHGWTIFHVLEECPLERIRKFIEDGKNLAYYVAKIVKVGKCWKEIVKIAEEGDVDLIMMTKGDSEEKMLLSSCGEKVFKVRNSS